MSAMLGAVVVMALSVPADRPLAALREMVRAVNAGDAKAYARVYAPDAAITIYGGGVLQGREAIEQYEAGLLRDFPEVRLAFPEVWQKGPLAVVHYVVAGRTPNGQAMGHEGLLFYRFLPSGLIAEERRYLDSLTPMAQLSAKARLTRAVPTMPSNRRTIVATGSAEEDRNVALVRELVAPRSASSDADLLSRLSEDAVLDEMIEPEPLAGQPAIRARLEAWRAAVPDLRAEIASILGAGDFVLVETVVRGMLTAPLGELSPSATPFAVHRAAVFEVKDGRIVRVVLFMNGKELAEAVGQWPPRPN
jgi:uncharacterized protein (TIGR02246 family)